MILMRQMILMIILGIYTYFQNWILNQQFNKFHLLVGAVYSEVDQNEVSQADEDFNSKIFPTRRVTRRTTKRTTRRPTNNYLICYTCNSETDSNCNDPFNFRVQIIGCPYRNCCEVNNSNFDFYLFYY